MIHTDALSTKVILITGNTGLAPLVCRKEVAPLLSAGPRELVALKCVRVVSRGKP